jgi:hypothetical protein
MDDELYYSDEPLSDSDLDYNNNPDVKSVINSYGGRKTKRYKCETVNVKSYGRDGLTSHSKCKSA